jgi:DNA-binding ferritin-like protein (Dps family)
VLLAKQKESRRERHITANKEFEKWVDRLTKNIDEAYKEIKKDVIGFFEESDLSTIL